ncbi:17069_t:CDS:2, partial [Acaulospora colombiana]
LRLLCRNPHGIFMAGDTAQQITSTAFRFTDLTALLYRLEQEADVSVVRQTRQAVHPKSFTLSVNYRSHGGIINCAHSVVKLLTKYWPDSIDTLEREQGLVDGPKPVFFSGWDGDTGHIGLNLVHSNVRVFTPRLRNVIDLAFLGILVRNEAARERLREQIGDIGLILTLYESKGLEFSDVLLYNFFQDSTITTEWRVLLNEVEDQRRGKVSAPSFDELRHVGVCSELKFLYVGLTRARNHLWIWDNSVQAEPMKTIYQANPSTVASSREEWEKMGRILFSRANYQQATICFERAGLLLLRDICIAYHLRKTARLLQVGSDERKSTFSSAAEAFFKCAAGDHTQSQACYIKAGECFVEAGNHKEASDSFCMAGEFTKGAKQARLAAEFDRAIEIIQTSEVDQIVASAIVEVCKVVKARSLFNSDEELLGHLEEYGFDKTPILVQLERFREAADIHLQDGKAAEAIDLYLRDGSEESLEKARQCVLDELWIQLPYGAAVLEERRPNIVRILKLATQITSASDHWIRESLLMVTIRTLAASRSDALVQLIRRGSSVLPVLGGKVPQRQFTRPVDLFFGFATSPLVAPFFKSNLNAKAKEFVPRNSILAHLPKNDGAKVSQEDASFSNQSQASSNLATAQVLQPSEPGLLNQIEDHKGQLSFAAGTQKEGASLQEISNEDEGPTDSLPDRPFTEAIDESQLKEEYSEKEHIAARNIQTTYRHYRRRTGKVAKRPVDQWFNDFSEATRQFQLPGRYLALLRGPLPHFMVCLDAFKADIQKQRSRAMKNLVDNDHRSIEDTMARLNAIK